jgi:HK97 family phage prohead protease
MTQREGGFLVLEYKSVAFRVKEVVDIAGGGWELSGYASTFGGEPDSYGDVVAKGAFLDSIAVRPTKFLYEHFEPIGKQLEIREDEHGLFGRWSIVDTTRGTDAYKLAKAGVLDSLSIGYVTVADEFRDDGIRILKKVDLFEVSAVAIPANRSALVTDVKSPTFERRSEDVRTALQEWLSHLKAGSAIRVKDGKEPFTTARRDHMTEVGGSLQDAVKEIEALLAPPAPPERINVGLELLRRRLERRGILEQSA